MSIKPSGIIFEVAIQFLDAGNLLFSNIKKADYVYPIIVNYALACELAIKASATKTITEESDGLLAQAEIESNAKVRGHSLVKMFEKLPDSIKKNLTDEFYKQTEKDLCSCLGICENYFIQARYPYEKMNRVTYHLTDVKILASGLIESVKKMGDYIIFEERK